MRGLGRLVDLFTRNGDNDLLLGSRTSDFLDGEAGLDLVLGRDGKDLLLGGSGPDALFGEQDDDLLAGEGGNDLLVGDGGRDLLIGGGGHNILAGGADRDTFLFMADRAASGGGAPADEPEDLPFDLVLDFKPGRDVIGLSGYRAADGSLPGFDDIVAENETLVLYGQTLEGTRLTLPIGPDGEDQVFLRNIAAEDLSAADFSLDPILQTPIGPALYFTADDGETGRELYRVTAQGAVEQVADINLGPQGASPANFFACEDLLYFTADNGLDGRELYRVDQWGYVEQVADINPGPGDSFGRSSPNYLCFDGHLFLAANNGSDGIEPYAVDPAGNVTQIADIKPGPGNSYPSDMFVFGDRLYFTATGPGGRELYSVSPDGDGAQVADLYPGAESSNPLGFTEYNGSLYFSAITGLDGTHSSFDDRELFKIGSDGSISQITDTEDGRVGDLTIFDDKLYYGEEKIVDYLPFGLGYYIPIKDLYLVSIDENGTVDSKAIITATSSSVDAPNSFLEWNGNLYFNIEYSSFPYDYYYSEIDGLVPIIYDYDKDYQYFMVGDYLIEETEERTYFEYNRWWTVKSPEGEVEIDALNASAPAPDFANRGATAIDFQSNLVFNNYSEPYRISLDESPVLTQIEDINPGPAGSEPGHYTEFLESLYLSATGPEGREVYRIDAQYSVDQVADISTGPGSSNPDNFFVFDPLHELS